MNDSPPPSCAPGKGRLLLVDASALSYRFLTDPALPPALSELTQSGTFGRLTPPLPAVTCTVQATLTTGAPPSRHGIVANGLYDRDRMKVSFWEQSSRLVQAPRLWEVARQSKPDFTSAMLFWQNGLGASTDLLLTPAPIHKHHGGMLESCYGKPDDLYSSLVARLGGFKLRHYWGPFTSVKSSQWIARATVEVMARFRPSLLLTYLPHLDYNQQRWGPSDERMRRDLGQFDALLGELLQAARRHDYDVLVVSEYGMHDVKGEVPLNRLLRREGLLRTRTVAGGEYLDYARSLAFAMVDHQAAHVFCHREAVEKTRRVLERTEGVGRVIPKEDLGEYGLDHPRSGDLVVFSEPQRWFSYAWWEDRRRKPDFATHVDIHNKPGYDPLELFFDWKRLSLSLDPQKLRGSHGCPPADEGAKAMYAADFELRAPGNELAAADVFALCLQRLGIPNREIERL